MRDTMNYFLCGVGYGVLIVATFLYLAASMANKPLFEWDGVQAAGLFLIAGALLIIAAK